MSHVLVPPIDKIAMYCKPLEELPENKYECKLYRIAAEHSSNYCSEDPFQS